jgi:hypothetical protein
MASANLRTSGKRGVDDAHHPAQRSNGWREARRASAAGGGWRRRAAAAARARTRVRACEADRKRDGCGTAHERQRPSVLPYTEPTPLGA